MAGSVAPNGSWMPCQKMWRALDRQERVARPARLRSSLAARAAAPRAHAHLGCRVQAAQTLVERKSSRRWWFTCQTCEQRFTVTMYIGLVNAWWSQVRNRAKEDPERLTAAGNLATSLDDQGKHAEAEGMGREVLAVRKRVLAVRKRVLGAEHPDTLTIAYNLASSLFDQGKHAEAEEILREVLAVRLGSGFTRACATFGRMQGK